MADGEHRFVGALMDVTAMKQSHAALEEAFEEIQALKDQLQRENIYSGKRSTSRRSLRRSSERLRRCAQFSRGSPRPLLPTRQS
jgi:hypothetical protein